MHRLALYLPGILRGGGVFMTAAGHLCAEPVNFSREVLPVLSDRCFYCHGPDPKHRKTANAAETAMRRPRRRGYT